MRAQCPTGNVSITSQADADAYGVNFPNCDTLPGDLTFSGLDINDLSPFSGVDVILGNLTMTGTFPGPSDFTGFDQLNRIGGDLWVENCARFRGFNGLDNLQRIGGTLHVMYTDSLESFSGLHNVEVVGGNVWALMNFNMLGFYGFNSLDSVYGSFEINTQNSPLLTFITVPPDLKYVGGNFHMSAYYATIITGGNNLDHIGGDLGITGHSLANISAFTGLNTLGGDLLVSDAEELTSLSGFNQLDSAGGILVDANPLLTIISGFPDLDQVDGFLWIDDNPLLTSLYGFAELDTVGQLVISSNNALTNIVALDQTIGYGSLQINDNPQLAICHVQSVCDRVLAPIIPIAAIDDNAPGCLSEAEVENQCILIANILPETAQEFMLYPNPGNGMFIHVRSRDVLRSIELLDQTGKVIAQYGGAVRTLMAPEVAGTYLVRALHADGHRSVVRMVRY